MRKYIFASGLSSILLLGACGGAEVSEDENIDEPTEEETVEETDSNESDSGDETSDESEDVSQLMEENEELKNQISELEEELALAQEDAAESDDGNGSSDEEEQESEEATQAEGEGTRTSPLAIGDTKTIEVSTFTDDYEEINGTAEIVVNDIVRGEEAYNALLAENEFNDPAPEGYEWVLINFSYRLLEMEDDNEPVYVSDDISIVADDGSSVENESAVTPDEFPWTELYSGGTAEGNVSKVVPINEPFLIRYDDYDNTVFVEVE